METWFTDADIAAVLNGDAPPDRLDLAELHAAIAELQLGLPEHDPVPSVELAALFELSVSSDGDGSSNDLAPRRGWLAKAAGLGVAGQALLATSAAAAVIGAGGALGVLPDPAQRAFDAIAHREQDGATRTTEQQSRAPSERADPRTENLSLTTPMEREPHRPTLNPRNPGAANDTRKKGASTSEPANRPYQRPVDEHRLEPWPDTEDPGPRPTKPTPPTDDHEDEEPAELDNDLDDADDYDDEDLADDEGLPDDIDEGEDEVDDIHDTE